MTVSITTLSELTHAARNFVATLSPKEEATLVTLSGELGAGKTAFVKQIASLLGVEEYVTSPTFVLEKIYELPQNSTGFSRLVHIDAYRLSDGKDLKVLGFDEIMQERTNLVMLEWPERVKDGLPAADVALSLSIADTGRTLSYG